MIRALFAGILIALGLSGCIPITTAGLLISGGGLALTGLHDCHQDGGCKYIPVPP